MWTIVCWVWSVGGSQATDLHLGVISVLTALNVVGLAETPPLEKRGLGIKSWDAPVISFIEDHGAKWEKQCFLCGDFSSKGVSHHYLYFGGDSKAGRVGSLLGEERNDFRCVLMEAVGGEARGSYLEGGLPCCCLGVHSWLFLAPPKLEALGKLSITHLSWPFLFDCYRL